MNAKSFVVGFMTPLVLGLLIGLLVVKMGWIPANADDQPGMLERKLAGTARDAWTERNAVASPDIPSDPATLRQGMELYKDNCAECHGSGKGKSMFGQSFYPPAPQWTDHGPHDDTYLLVYTAKRGIRLTGMPAFGSMLKDDELWKILTFVKHIQELPPDIQAEYRARKASAADTPSPAPSASASASPGL